MIGTTLGRIGIVAVGSGELVKSFDHLFYMLAWTRDGGAVTYADVKDGVWNLWNQPIDGGPPKAMTNFTSDQIFSFGWSTDGSAWRSREGPSPTTSCSSRTFRQGREVDHTLITVRGSGPSAAGVRRRRG
jgi:hypothetical protein